jgi:hypothetical protein
MPRPISGVFESGPAIRLADVTAILRIFPETAANPGPNVSDISGDGKIGLPEAVHGLRPVGRF